jgi:3D-(3,5/4)-trihydroxycyclohexane-1,2-dione acylhydrolase (decyclizing)
MKNRIGTFACISSIGPGATNMVTGAACATINRMPVLIIPGDIFAGRRVAPVLQQLESPQSQDISVNDCFKPVSRYWDRISRPEQLITSLPEVMRVLVSPADTGAVTLSLPQDVQAEAFDFPEELFRKKVWRIPRPRPDITSLQEAASLIKASEKPVIIAGGGIIYSEASDVLKKLVELTDTGKRNLRGRSLRYDHPLNLGGWCQALGEMNPWCRPGYRYRTRYAIYHCFQTAFQHPRVRFVSINIAELVPSRRSCTYRDARACLEELLPLVSDFRVAEEYTDRAKNLSVAWDEQVSRICSISGKIPVTQAEVVGAVNDFTDPRDVVLCAAGSLPGDLHKLWRTRDTKGFHLEYGYSTMGYECAAGIGAKMACPDREIYVMVGDGNYLMMNSEIVTSIQEGIKFTIILLNNNGFASIGGLSQSIGSQRFGTQYRYRDETTGLMTGGKLPVDYARNARSLGAFVIEAHDIDSLKAALAESKHQDRTTVITIETDIAQGVPGYAWGSCGGGYPGSSRSAARAGVPEKEKDQRYYL